MVYVYNEAGELLLLHRARPPNQGRYSPIGGKLEQATGESPYMCALREIEEEIGLTLALEHIQLFGIVSERGYEGQTHWLMFCFEITRRVNIPGGQIDEGSLEWVDPARVLQLNIPKTDRDIIWPLVLRHSRVLNPAAREVFSVHIDCTEPERYAVTQEHPIEPG